MSRENHIVTNDDRIEKFEDWKAEHATRHQNLLMEMRKELSELKNKFQIIADSNDYLTKQLDELKEEKEPTDFPSLYDKDSNHTIKLEFDPERFLIVSRDALEKWYKYLNDMYVGVGNAQKITIIREIKNILGGDKE